MFRMNVVSIKLKAIVIAVCNVELSKGERSKAYQYSHVSDFEYSKF